MPEERRFSISNTGNARISVILNYREAGCQTFDLPPGGRIDASLRELACLVINDIDNLAVFGQNALWLKPEG